MAAVTICRDFGAQEHSLSLFPLFPHLSAVKWWDWMPWSSFFECWVLSQLFHSSLLLSSRGSLAPLHFCHKGGVLCISEVTDISPSNLDSSLCFIQVGILHDVQPLPPSISEHFHHPKKKCRAITPQTLIPNPGLNTNLF